MTETGVPSRAPSNPLGGIIANIFGGGSKSGDSTNIETCSDMEFLICRTHADLHSIVRGDEDEDDEDDDEHEHEPAAARNEEEKVTDVQTAGEHASVLDTARLSGGSTDFGTRSPARDRDETSANVEDADPSPALVPAPSPPPPPQQFVHGNSHTIPQLSPTEQDLASCMARIKSLILDEHNDFGKKRAPSDASASGQTPPHASALIYALTKHPDFVPDVLTNLLRGVIPFEARKDFAFMVCFMLVCGIHDDGMLASGTSTSVSAGADGLDETYRFYRDISANMEQYVLENFETIMDPLVRGHDVVGAAGSLAVPGGRSEDDTKGSVAGEANAAAPSRQIQKSTPDVALHCGAMLRAALRHPKLFRLFLSDDNVSRYVLPFLDRYVHQPNFEVQGDALETMNYFFTGGINPAASPAPPRQGSKDTAEDKESANTGDIASEFLERQYALIVEDRLNNKLLSPKTSYVAKRASIQLLSTVLLTRSNYAVMMKYVSSRHNLRTIMLLLRDQSGHITFDAFHVFKIFVANPQKTREVIRILVDNRTKLIKYLDGLHKDRESSDIQFRDEKKLVISTLEGLELEE